MESNSQSGNEVRVDGNSSGVVLLGRLVWVILGPMFALLITCVIVNRAGWFTPWDAALGIVVALMVGGRWVEQRSGSAMKATGEPATVEHYKRYVRVLLPLAAGVWVAANVLGNHILV
ncbi:MAG: hypothetical protein ABII12_03345 [Planctomycetota bacterium]